jgi:hypothetical protein
MASAALAVGLACGCAPGAAVGPAGARAASAEATFGPLPAGRIAMRVAADRPPVTMVVREGDPMAAVVAVVVTHGGSAASAALSAVVEQRLGSLGFATADARVDRDAYRVRALVASPEQAASFARALHRALAAPVVAGGPEVGAARRRLEALRRRPLDAAALVAVAQCTGELGLSPGEAVADLGTPAGAAQLEAWRRTAHGALRVAIGVAGPAATGEAVANAVARGPAWEPGASPADAWPARNAAGTYPLAASPGAPTRLSLALRVRDPYAATAIAERAAGPEAALASRLARLGAWKLRRVSATVHPRGACLGAVLERERPEATGGEADAARAASLVVHELETQLGEARADGSVAGRQVLHASDPREAASLAAWWSLATRLEAGPDRLAAALGVAPPWLAPAGPSAALEAHLSEAQARFAQELERAREAWGRPQVESRARVELGQGELWVLVGSPCGVLADAERDAGITALAASAAVHAGAGRHDEVSIEPWVRQDGAGVVAHAAPRVAEGAHALAGRVADAAARVFVSSSVPERSVAAAREALLGLGERASGPLDEGFVALARELAPGHPAWLAPFGSFEALAQAGASAASNRWASLAEGPVRVAVLANADGAQAAAAVRAADRWVPRGALGARSCPPLAASDGSVRSVRRDATVRARKGPSRAWIGVAVQRPDAAASTMLELLAEGLDGADGWLARSLGSFEPGCSHAAVRVAGGRRLGALGIELTCSEGQLDDAVRQARALFQRLSKGAAAEAHLARAAERLARRDLAARLDPRHRLEELWQGEPASRASVRLGDWNAWMHGALDEANVQVVRLLAAE